MDGIITSAIHTFFRNVDYEKNKKTIMIMDLFTCYPTYNWDYVRSLSIILFYINSNSMENILSQIKQYDTNIQPEISYLINRTQIVLKHHIFS